jgi:integrase
MRCRFYLSNSLKGGYSSLEARVTFAGVNYKGFLAGLHVKKEFWDSNSQRLKNAKAYPNAKSINQILNLVSQKIEESVYEAILQKKKPNEIRQAIKEVIAEVLGLQQRKTDLFLSDAFLLYLKQREKDKKSTYQAYVSLGNSLFGGKRKEGFQSEWGRKIAFTDIDRQFAEKYKGFMEAQGFKPASVRSYINRMITFLGWCADKKRKYVYPDVIQDFSFKIKTVSQPFSLTGAEFIKIASADLGHETLFFESVEKYAGDSKRAYRMLDELENARNLLVFLVLTGQRPGDIMGFSTAKPLRWNDLQETENGLIWQLFQEKVAGNFMSIPVDGWGKVALTRQERFKAMNKSGEVFMPFSRTVCNRKIKMLLYFLGMDRTVKIYEIYKGKPEVKEKPLHEYFAMKHCRSTASSVYSQESERMAMDFTGHTVVGTLRKHYLSKDAEKMRKAARGFGGGDELERALSEVENK